MSKKQKILIIEDEQEILDAYAKQLQCEGYEIIKASDGVEGLEKAKKENPDLILLDIILPGKNGFEVLDELKDRKKTKGIPVIMLTNLDSVRDIEKAVALGAKTYLVKSNYGLEEIVAKVKIQLKK